jgi:DNA-binding transcriptional MocR family regulator
VRAVVERADGVSAAPGSAFGATANLLRLSFAAAAPEEIESGVARLAAAMPEA